MITSIDETTVAIKSEIQMIQENRKHRNDIYQSCMDHFITNLKNQIHQLESTEPKNIQRNKNISTAFQTVYDKIITSSNITLRKIKQTSYEKKLFWENLIKNNAQFESIPVKKQFYLQKRDAEDRYYDTIDQQKNNKKVPYAVLLGKNKKKQELREWKQKNRPFEEKVHQGTATINQWQNTWQRNAQEAADREMYYRPSTQIFDQNFVRSPNTVSNQQLASQYEQIYSSNQLSTPLYEVSGNTSEFGFLKNFEKKKR